MSMASHRERIPGHHAFSRLTDRLSCVWFSKNMAGRCKQIAEAQPQAARVNDPESGGKRPLQGLQAQALNRFLYDFVDSSISEGALTSTKSLSFDRMPLFHSGELPLAGQGETN